MIEALEGGRIGQIKKSENNVFRPAHIWTSDVHCFLRTIIDLGADFVPEPRGIANGEEIVSFMPGDVYNVPFPQNLLCDSMLISSANLLRKFHTYSEQYIVRLTHREQWMLPVVEPVEVMCHGDFAPYNVTIVNDEARGIIDFDTLHPGSRMWDIVYAVYRWVPFTISADSGFSGSTEEQIRKTKLFLDTYGVTSADRSDFVKLIVKRLECLTDYMRAEAQKGNGVFQQHIDEGHLQGYLEDIEYLEHNSAAILSGIM
ncbi:MAG: aminoglycoside phosphotransferase family protein [Oscillospiraceae bacterium]|nr:aminoglycoside phosphotransferase family protein [Oscillospiraceae bacterium]